MNEIYVFVKILSQYLILEFHAWALFGSWKIQNLHNIIFIFDAQSFRQSTNILIDRL